MENGDGKSIFGVHIWLINEMILWWIWKLYQMMNLNVLIIMNLWYYDINIEALIIESSIEINYDILKFSLNYNKFGNGS